MKRHRSCAQHGLIAVYTGTFCTKISSYEEIEMLNGFHLHRNGRVNDCLLASFCFVMAVISWFIWLFMKTQRWMKHLRNRKGKPQFL